MNQLPDFSDLESLGNARVLLLGDLMLDRYTWGDAQRVSPEAPVLVLQADLHEIRPGGAASVAALLRGLGAEVTLAGVVGADAEGRALRNVLTEMNVDCEFVLTDSRRPTTCKHRFMGRAAGRHPHQILRVDREVDRGLDADQQSALAAAVASRLGGNDILLVSDYGKGTCTEAVLQSAFAVVKRCKKRAIVDPARTDDYHRYRGADVVVPNRSEAASATGLCIASPDDAFVAGEQILRKWELPAVLVKLDRDGMVLVAYNPSNGRMMRSHFATRSREVYDVTGAGDMVLAVLGVALAGGMALGDAAQIANAAAGLEVQRVGVESVDWLDIHYELSGLAGGVKQVTADQIAVLAEAYRRRGASIVLTNGCFDLLHVGHVTYLQEAAGLGAVLIVAINSDASVRRLKGVNRPVVGEGDRAAMLAGLACVDHVVVFDEDTPQTLVERIRPDVLVKGGTYSVADIVGREIVESYGGRVCVTQHVGGVSTTALIKEIRNSR